ncbi:MAG: hypothetical protein Aureis2KO_10020 [Aureisphaera sp.]
MSSPTIHKIIELDFATFELYDRFIVSTINEGVVFDLPHLEKLKEIFNTYYPEKPFISIANRKFDYTINPTCLLHSDLFPNLLGIGVVCYTKSALETATFEKKFYKGSLEIFSDMDECMKWAEGKIVSQ